MLKIMDYILIVFIFFSSLYLLFYLQNYFSNENSSIVKVTIGSNVYGEYDLNKNQEVIIKNNDNYNKLLISNGIISMIDANCNDLVCVHSKPIEKSYESITCLPNKVFIELSVEEDKKDDKNNIDEEIDGFAS